MDLVGLAMSIVASLIVATIVSYMMSRRISRLVVSRVLDGIVTFRDMKRLAREYARKPRRRYIVFEVASAGEVSMEGLERTLLDAIRVMLGNIGLVESGFKLIHYDEARKRGIIRVRHDYKFKILGILGLVREVEDSRVMIIPITVTGSLKNARKRVMA